MATVSAGSTATYTFTGTQEVTVSLDSAEYAEVYVSSPAGVRLFGQRISSSRSLGTFESGSVLSITAIGGTVDYTVSDVDTAYGLTTSQVIALNDGKILSKDGGLYALSEATPYVTMTATGTAFSGACELAGWYCSVAAGNITIYDNTSATGTPIVPATPLVVGPLPIFGAGTNHRLQLTTGCHVVLSGAATVRVAVGG